MAIFTFTRFDTYEWDSVTYTKGIPETDKNLILGLTAAQLKSMARNNIVGKTNTMCGEKSYYADAIHLGGFKLSIQANYPVWKKRQRNGTPHETPITAEEFDAVMLFEVEITHGQTVIVEPCQMSIREIINFLKEGLK